MVGVIIARRECGEPWLFGPNRTDADLISWLALVSASLLVDVSRLALASFTRSALIHPITNDLPSTGAMIIVVGGLVVRCVKFAPLTTVTEAVITGAGRRRRAGLPIGSFQHQIRSYSNLFEFRLAYTLYTSSNTYRKILIVELWRNGRAFDSGQRGPESGKILSSDEILSPKLK